MIKRTRERVRLWLEFHDRLPGERQFQQGWLGRRKQVMWEGIDITILLVNLWD